eukprot:scpid62205/ scgid22387/ EF-hand domain-containing family member B
MASLTQTVYGGQFRDTAPSIRAAGKTISPPRSTTKECIATTLERPPTPEIVRKFQPTIKRPEVGEERVHFGRAYDDSTTARTMRHGVDTKPSLFTGDLANPARQTNVQQRMEEMKTKVYASSKTAPLGHSHDQTPGLPRSFDPMRSTCGRRTKYDGTVQEVVNPDKSEEQVEQESSAGHNFYAKTHNDYYVGERVDRDYDWSTYPRNFKFGVETPCDPRGIYVPASLRWLHFAEEKRAAKLTNDSADKYHEKYTHQLGKPLDPLKETRNLPEDHVFGLLFPPDEFGAADLIHNRKQINFLRGHDRLRGVVAALRHQLKKLNYQRFSDLQAAFRHYDKRGTGKIDVLQLREICEEYGLPAEDDVLLTLVDWCDADGDGLIDYDDFADFLNWRSKMPEAPLQRLMQPEFSGTSRSPSNPSSNAGSGRTSVASTPPTADGKRKKSGRSVRQIDPNVGGYFTWSRQTNSVVGGVRTEGWRSYGVPTIRSDLAAPRLRRVSDRRNYGDEADANALISPSIYSQAGVTSRDFFQPRSKEEIRRIFTALGADITDSSFDELWEKAKSEDVNGLVSMESFRAVLEQAHIEQLQLQGQLVSPGRSREAAKETPLKEATLAAAAAAA